LFWCLFVLGFGLALACARCLCLRTGPHVVATLYVVLRACTCYSFAGRTAV
jgi:hypothetical protein